MYSKQQPKTRAAVARIPEVEADESGVVIGERGGIAHVAPAAAAAAAEAGGGGDDAAAALLAVHFPAGWARKPKHGKGVHNGRSPLPIPEAFYERGREQVKEDVCCTDARGAQKTNSRKAKRQVPLAFPPGPV